MLKKAPFQHQAAGKPCVSIPGCPGVGHSPVLTTVGCVPVVEGYPV